MQGNRTGRKKRDPVELFWSKVEAQPDGCWLWCAGLNHEGYGKFSTGGRTYAAHRFSYEQVTGLIPSGLEIDHLCRTRRCVNPAHLEAVTKRENVRRAMAARGWVTHCKRGHEFTPENTYVRKNGTRFCNRCRTIRDEARAMRAAV